MPLLAAGLIGCAEVAAGDETVAEAVIPAADPVAAEEPTLTALRNGAFATPEELGGFSTDGVGVFLTAVNNIAELTLYVVAPAQSATFGRPALYVTTQDGEHSKTETAEFEDVTLAAGESRVLSKAAEGTLLEVFADFAAEP